MSDYATAAEFYDLLYRDENDYAAEAFVELARMKCPEGTFTFGDMTGLDLPKRYDAVTCRRQNGGGTRQRPAAARQVSRSPRPVCGGRATCPPSCGARS